jgi:hypothetical protein
MVYPAERLTADPDYFMKNNITVDTVSRLKAKNKGKFKINVLGL